MSIPASLLVILLALDGPVGFGIPPVIARFGGDSMPAIPAIFARHPADSMPQVEIEWFLDGDALAAPVGKSGFVYARTPAHNPVLTQGSFQLDLPVSEKSVTYRGRVMDRSGGENHAPLTTLQLVVFPPEIFDRDWAAVAGAEIPLTLIGTLPGLREFLRGKEIRFREGDLNDPGTIDRNGLLVVDASGHDRPVFPPGLARAILVLGAPDRSWQLQFGVHHNDDNLIWTQRHPQIPFSRDPLTQAAFLQIAKPLLTKIP